MCTSACVNACVCVCACLACVCFVCAQDQDLFLRMLRLVVSRDSSLKNGASVSRMEATSTETPFLRNANLMMKSFGAVTITPTSS